MIIPFSTVLGYVMLFWHSCQDMSENQNADFEVLELLAIATRLPQSTHHALSVLHRP